ncbi:MAG: ORF6N domain-containing protein [Candidatus Omnitrophota bacterium]
MDRVVSVDKIENRIYQIIGKRVMMDKDLAELYEVETYQLTRQVRRNIDRFPIDFMFQLTKQEFLSCQFGSSNRGGTRYMPYVFTQEGVAMLSSVLNSERAILVNIQIMRVFVSLRRVAVTYVGLKRKIDEMEKKYNGQFAVVFEAIRKLLEPLPQPPKRRIGFHSD